MGGLRKDKNITRNEDTTHKIKNRNQKIIETYMRYTDAVQALGEVMETSLYSLINPPALINQNTQAYNRYQNYLINLQQEMLSLLEFCYDETYFPKLLGKMTPSEMIGLKIVLFDDRILVNNKYGRYLTVTYKSDGGGKTFECNDIKIFNRGSSWKTRLALWSRPNATVHIQTYSLADMKYIDELLKGTKNKIKIIANTKFDDKAKIIIRKYANVEIRLHDETHSKVALISNETIILGSANFGKSSWYEQCVGMHQKEMYNYLIEEFYKLWKKCIPISP